MKKIIFPCLVVLMGGAIFFGSAKDFVLARATTAAPKLISPCNNETTSLTPTLKWEPVEPVENEKIWGYQWEIKNVETDRPVYNRVASLARLSSNEDLVEGTVLETNNNYQWRAQSINTLMNESTPSEWCLFNTIGQEPVPLPTGEEPVIQGIEPSSGPAGTIISIVGENFSCGTYSGAKRTVWFIPDGDITTAIKDDSPKCDSLSLKVLKTMIPSFPESVKNIEIKVDIRNILSEPFTFSLTSLAPSPGGTAPGGASGATVIPGPACEGQPLTFKNPKSYKTGDKTVAYDGLVPCGKCVLVDPPLDENGNPQLENGLLSGTGQYTSCQFCHFFVMFDGIINFLLIDIITPLAILLAVVGGAFLVFSAGDPGKVAKGKSILTSVVIGMALILGAWLIVNIVFAFIGVSAWTGLRGGWFSINCQVSLP